MIEIHLFIQRCPKIHLMVFHNLKMIIQKRKRCDEMSDGSPDRIVTFMEKGNPFKIGSVSERKRDENYCVVPSYDEN